MSTIFFSEDQLKKFSKPLSDTDKKKCEHAIESVKNALSKGGFNNDNVENNLSYEMSKDDWKIKILLQGSFANNTNIKSESDVDVAVIMNSQFNSAYRTWGNNPQSNNNFGFINVTSNAKEFKSTVLNCLRDYFNEQVQKNNKSIKVYENTYRSNIDVVPAARYRNYLENYDNDPDNYLQGILIEPDNGEPIVNYPELHIQLGKEKNNQTNHSYKKQVRIIKNMKELMKEKGYESASKVSSFGLESLLWNIPDSYYKKYTTLRFIFDDIVHYLDNHSNEIYVHFKEANGVKNLCNSIDEKNEYIEFIKDLLNFYNYDIAV